VASPRHGLAAVATRPRTSGGNDAAAFDKQEYLPRPSERPRRAAERPGSGSGRAAPTCSAHVAATRTNKLQYIYSRFATVVTSIDTRLREIGFGLSDGVLN